MCAPSSCQHRGSMIAQKQACMAGSKTANSGRINPHRDIIPRKNQEKRKTAKSKSKNWHTNNQPLKPQATPPTTAGGSLLRP